MSKSLTELRAERPQNRPERSLTVCLKPDLVAEVFALDEERRNLRVEVMALNQRAESDDAQKSKHEIAAKLAELHARLDEIEGTEGRLSVLSDAMAEHEGELRLRANLTDGEWRRWVNEHPARVEGEPGYQRDQEVTAGYCSADDLIDALDLFVHSWNGDALADGDWAILEPNVAGPDKKQAATAVVSMYESRLDFSQLRFGINASLRKSSEAGQPSKQVSPKSGSSAGNPKNTTSTSTSTTPGDGAASS